MAWSSPHGQERNSSTWAAPCQGPPTGMDEELTHREVYSVVGAQRHQEKTQGQTPSIGLQHPSLEERCRKAGQGLECGSSCAVQLSCFLQSMLVNLGVWLKVCRAVLYCLLQSMLVNLGVWLKVCRAVLYCLLQSMLVNLGVWLKVCCAVLHCLLQSVLVNIGVWLKVWVQLSCPVWSSPLYVCEPWSVALGVPCSCLILSFPVSVSLGLWLNLCSTVSCPKSKRWITTSFLWRKVPESDARGVRLALSSPVYVGEPWSVPLGVRCSCRVLSCCCFFSLYL